MTTMTPTNARHAPRGFALPAAIFALAVMTILVTGGAFLARQESRIGAADRHARQAVYIADEGISETLLDWSTAGFGDLAVGDSDTHSGTADGGTWTAEVLRTSEQAYFVRSEGEVTRGGSQLSGARRELGLLVRVLVPDIEPPAAIATPGDMVVAGSSEIEGHDTDPDAWDAASCPDPAEDKPGILTTDSTNVSEDGDAHTIDGEPPVAEDPDMTSESLLDFGDTTWDDLAAMANKVYPSGVTIDNTAPDSVSTDSGYACRTSTSSNWGDPLNPGAACYSYFPIIYASGNMKINSSSHGQGILLVEGDLRIQGGFEFYGTVIVKGTFVTAGTGGHVNGGVIAANADLDASTVTGNAVVTNSTCVAKRAIENNSALTRPKPLAERNWMDLTAVSF